MEKTTDSQKHEGEDLKNFTESFFTNLGSSMSWKGEVLFVKDAPVEFEHFYGKKAPYYLAFEAWAREENYELVISGSPMLKTMRDYLSNRGQTSLLKLDIQTEPLQDINSCIKFLNAKVSNIKRNKEYRGFAKFTFLTLLQYLNEKEQVITPIYVENGEVIFPELDGYTLVEGKKEEMGLPDVEKDYELAKAHLKGQIAPDLARLSAMLEDKLEKEIARIMNHYVNYIQEKKQQLLECQKQEVSLKEQLKSGKVENKENVQFKLKRVTEQREQLEKENYAAKAQQEQEFLINEENRKHGLSVSNRMLNTSVVYYPIFNYQFMVENGEAKRLMDLKYNPMEKTAVLPTCDNCKKDVQEIMLCSGGHITCVKCSGRCQSCGKEACAVCLTKSCELCGKHICRKCSVRCHNCGKNMCANHTKKGTTSGHAFCTNCLTRCSLCGSMALREQLKECPGCGSLICDVCAKNSLYKVAGGYFCKNCSQKCITCGKILPKKEFRGCSKEDCRICKSKTKCLSCRQSLCPRLKK